MNAKHFVSFWIAALFVALTSFGAAAQPVSHFQLDQWRAGESAPSALKGDWHFVWEHLLTPEEAVAAFHAGTADVVPVPANWTSFQPTSEDNPYGHGQASFIAHLTLPAQPAAEQMLHVEMIQNSYRILWVPLDNPGAAQVITENGVLAIEPRCFF